MTTMMRGLDPFENTRAASIDTELLDKWQRDLPLVPRPFSVIAERLRTTEHNVLARLVALKESGVVARVGGVVRPNTLGASTLAALSAPALLVDELAARLAAIDGINHIYLRENEVNIWFVVTGPDRAYVDEALARVERETYLPVLDFRLEEAYHIDLGFALNGSNNRRYHNGGSAAPARKLSCDSQDRALAQSLTEGLPLVERPFAEVGRQLGLSEAETIGRLDRLLSAGVLPRIGVIVRHRALGWRSNAMVVFDVAPDHIASVGAQLASAPGINLCYRRTRYETVWPYNLYCMVHARSRQEALTTLDRARSLAGLEDLPTQILFSLRCFKQTGALISARRLS